MILEKLHIIITILAAIAITIACIFAEQPFFNSMITIAVTIVVFYVIGSIIKGLLKSKVPVETEISIEVPTDTTNAEKSADDELYGWGNSDLAGLLKEDE